MRHITFREWDKSAFSLSRKVKTHVVLVRRSSFQDVREAVFAGVSNEEAERAERFFHAKDKELYLLGKFVLRSILADLTGLSPKEITFSITGNKKPFFQEQEFNITHTGDHIYLAFSPFALGIDAEKINPDFDPQPIIDSCFSEEDRAKLLSGNDRLNFYTVWTRKEALLKATGEGLCDDLKQVRALHDEVKRNGRNYFLSTRFHDNYIVSYATLHPDTDEECWIWD
ncbi:4'-phosphopantetheinyl transferase family protein [Runella sp.]|uniref:4'-phosphopantetheinyl transferase family protein n=1 Tax=Runella sp. TaxID=1960881 RepID=UPI003D0EA92A